jgi:hypothetical protein
VRWRERERLDYWREPGRGEKKREGRGEERGPFTLFAVWFFQLTNIIFFSYNFSINLQPPTN